MFSSILSPRITKKSINPEQNGYTCPMYHSTVFFRIGSSKLVPLPSFMTLIYLQASLSKAGAPGAFMTILPYQNLKKIFFIGVELIYNVVLVLGVQQSDSVIHIHISTLF